MGTDASTPPPTPIPTTASPTTPPTPIPTTASPTTTVSPSSNPSKDATSFEEVFFNDFEAPNNWGNFYKGGMHAGRHTAGKYAYSGSAALRIRRGDGTNSSIISNAFDVSKYTHVNVRFIFKSKTVEAGEAFALEYSVDGGATYDTVKKWTKGVDFENKNFYGMTEDITVKPDDDNMKIRFIAF